MLNILARYKNKKKLIEVYEPWDVDPSDIVGYDCTKADRGKFLPFDDGSEWFVKIVGVSDMAIKTEAGTVKREDIVHCSRIKWPGGYYSGVPSTHEHEFVRGYTKREKRISTKLINGTLDREAVTPRCVVLTIEKLQTKAGKHGIDEDFIIGKLKGMANDINNRHALGALTKLSRICGVELEQQKVADKQVGLFQQINNSLTIQQARRKPSGIPSVRDVRKMIPADMQTGDVFEIFNRDHAHREATITKNGVVLNEPKTREEYMVTNTT